MNADRLGAACKPSCASSISRTVSTVLSFRWVSKPEVGAREGSSWSFLGRLASAQCDVLGLAAGEQSVDHFDEDLLIVAAEAIDLSQALRQHGVLHRRFVTGTSFSVFIFPGLRN